MPDERYSYISSSLVREVARLGGPIENFVPPEVAQSVGAAMRKRLGEV
jgi:pantetheine-phosphate adenylyltransferase